MSNGTDRRGFLKTIAAGLSAIVLRSPATTQLPAATPFSATNNRLYLQSGQFSLTVYSSQAVHNREYGGDTPWAHVPADQHLILHES